MAHAKIEWQHHIQAYLAQYTDSKSIPDYARANGINPPSARRTMRPAVLAALADRAAGTETPTKAINVSGSTIKIGCTVRRKALELAAEAHQQREDRASSDRPPRSDHFHESRSTEGDHLEDNYGQSDGRRKKNSKKLQQGPISGVNDGGQGMNESPAAENNFFQDRPPTRPRNANAMTFGGYASLLEIDGDISEAVAALGQGDYDLSISIARHMQMTRAVGGILNAIAQDYDAKKPWIDEMGQPMPRAQAELQTLFGASQRMTELEAAISRRKMAMRKQALVERQAEHEAHPLTRAQRITRTRDILAQRAEQELSALETSYLFVNEGLDIPQSLQIEVNKEVSWLEPANDLGCGITDEELERLSREYQANRKYQKEVWLPAREVAIAAMIEQEAAYQAGELLGEDNFVRQEEDFIQKDNAMRFCNDGDGSPEDEGSDLEEVW